MKIAAIDIGTNSIHTIVAQVRADGSYEIIDRLKDMVMLGEGQTRDMRLSSRAIAEGLLALGKAKAIAERHSVERLLAVATSAVREARNGASFIDLVRRETGIEVRAITGEEEARLIYLAVRDSIHLGKRKALLVDVGGGSVEFIVGDRTAAYLMDSQKIGVLRLLDRFPISDPVKNKEAEAIQRYVAEQVHDVLAQARQIGFDCIVGTSGTALTLLALALERTGKEFPMLSSINNEVVPAKEVKAVCRWLLQSSAAERRNHSRIDPRRVNSIVMGAGLWLHLLEAAPVAEVIACDRALREGVIIDYVQQHQNDFEERALYPDPRRRSVFALAQRCDWDEVHSRHVARLALSIFDQLKAAHGLGDDARSLLEYGCYLHDIGYHINAKAHHKHGYYLVLNGDLLGFTRQEIQIIAALVRYHRKRKPDRAHAELAGLSAAQRRMVDVLAGILRVADGLDRTHFSVVQTVHVSVNPQFIHLELMTWGDAELEMWFALQKAGLLEATLQRTLRVELSATALANASV